MPFPLPTRRSFGALMIAASFAFAIMPASTLALDPPRPLPNYQPAFVTERGPGAWKDCIWASASMLLDKWTNGATTVSREQLRALSGDTEDGSTLADVRHAFARLGLTLSTSPSGGNSVTWSKLFDRLGHGAGAIVLGDYSQLPRRYGRWDPAYWSKDGTFDDHALYLDRYDRQTGRILVMDPLAPAGWTGEWIPVSALRKFAWRGAGGSLWTAMTPTAMAAPFDGVELGDPVASADGSSMTVSWPIDHAPDGWAYSGATVTTQMTPVSDADITDAVISALSASDARLDASMPLIAEASGGSPAASPLSAAPAASPLSAAPVVPAPTTPFATASGTALTATIPLPTPGVYSVNVRLTDTRFGDEVVTAGPFKLYVPGPRAATFIVPGHLFADPTALVHLSVVVRNSGTESWVDPVPVPWLPLDLQRPRNTRLTGTWVPEPLSQDKDRGETIIPEPIDFGPLAIEPGLLGLIDSMIQVPSSPGYWRLVLNVVDDQVGSLAPTGSAPGVIDIEVLGPSHPRPQSSQAPGSTTLAVRLPD